jgi:hypothetical protein
MTVAAVAFVALIAMHGITYPSAHLGHIAARLGAVAADPASASHAMGASGNSDSPGATIAGPTHSDTTSGANPGSTHAGLGVAICAAAVVGAATTVISTGPMRERRRRPGPWLRALVFGPEPPVPRPLPSW